MVITDIKNTKIKVDNEAHGGAILYTAKLLDYKWRSEFIREYDYLFFESDLSITQCGTEHTFRSCEEKEIFFYNGEFHDKPQDEIEPLALLDEEEVKKWVAAASKLIGLGYIFHNGEWLSKEEIEKQERLEAAYDLYLCGWHEGVKGWGATLNFNDFCYAIENNHIVDYVAIVDKTGYHKGEL